VHPVQLKAIYLPRLFVIREKISIEVSRARLPRVVAGAQQKLNRAARRTGKEYIIILQSTRVTDEAHELLQMDAWCGKIGRIPKEWRRGRCPCGNWKDHWRRARNGAPSQAGGVASQRRAGRLVGVWIACRDSIVAVSGKACLTRRRDRPERVETKWAAWSGSVGACRNTNDACEVNARAWLPGSAT
jgi:hypothetical protein